MSIIDWIGEKIEDGIDCILDNPVKSALTVTAVVISGGTCLVAAPAIAGTIGATGLLGAASTGTAISSLSGAALTNASLAAMGGGALAAGGGGMATGTAVVTGIGAVTGGGVMAGGSTIVEKVID